MKIRRLILKNFSAIKNAMNAYQISIDFTKTINKICLIIGKNGSGKTTILSMLHPFADVGNLDVRNGYSLILPDKDGYKEIEIEKDGDIYLIKHFYTSKKDANHSVKSYIFKNGEDLNVNGNVTSFKEIVKEELQIEPDYLKLIRLGSNVTSMIDLTATERKNFMSKIMDDIGIYLEYYKSINLKLKQIDELISHTIDKIKKLNIIDEKTQDKEIHKIEKEIEGLENRKIELTKILFDNTSVIDNYGDKSEFLHNGKELEKKYNKMKNILDSKSKDLKSVQYYNDTIDKYETNKSTNENEISSSKAIIDNTLSHLDLLQTQLHEISVQIIKEKNVDDEISRMNDNLNSSRLKLSTYESALIDFNPNFTKKEYETFFMFLKNMQKILNRTYEFGKPPIEKVIDLISTQRNVMNYINSHLLDIDEKKKNDSSTFINALIMRFMLGKEDVKIECNKECQAKTLFYQIQNLIKNSEIEDKNSDVEFYHSMEFVYNNISSVLLQFSDYEDIIKRLPESISEQFKLSNIYDNIKKLKFIYDDKKMNDILSLITEYDNYQELKKVCEDEENKLAVFRKSSNSSYLEKQGIIINENISNEQAKIKRLKERIFNLTEENKEISKTLEVLYDEKETVEEFDDIKSQYELFIDDKSKYLEAEDNINTTNKQLDDLNIQNKSLNTQLQSMISSLDQYNSLLTDNAKFSKIFDDLTIMKEALSSKTGIPLRIISSYLNNTNELTNEFLNIAYDGNIYIDNFNITSTEFSIPFYNRGVRLDDVKYASQGELSFLSIALSFALANQVLSKYNIMLLDEIDGPLDSSNREKFIKILEAQIDKIGSEQSFLITHNSMFSSYPVDILDLSFGNNHDDYNLANFINIELIK